MLFYYPYFCLFFKVLFFSYCHNFGNKSHNTQAECISFGLPLTLACVDKTDINLIEKCIRVYINYVYNVLYLSYETE